RRWQEGLRPMAVEPAHAVEVMGLVPPLLYFLVVIWRQRIGVIDAVVLIALYVGYLWILMRNPPREVESLEHAPVVSRWAYRQPGWEHTMAIGGLLLVGRVLPFAPA